MAEPELGQPFCGLVETSLDRAAIGICRWTHAPVSIAHQMGLPAANITAEQIDGVFRRTAALWSSACGLDLRFQADPNANIIARVEPMDGPNGILGESYLPCGIVNPRTQLTQRYDSGERWTLSFLERVVLHEVGHALGLPHAPQGAAVMSPYLTDFAVPQPWDIAEIQARYGAPQPPPKPEPPPTPIPIPLPTPVPMPAGPDFGPFDLEMARISDPFTMVAGSPILFRFHPRGHRLFAAFTTGDLALTMELLDRERNPIEADRNHHGMGANAALLGALRPGTYFLRVRGLTSAMNGTFRVKVEAVT